MRLLKTGISVLKGKVQFYFLTLLNLLVVKSKRNVYIFDAGLKKDNVWEIAKLLNDSDEYSNYRIYYYTDVMPSNKEEFKRVEFINSKGKALWKRLRSKYIFHSYMEMKKMKPVWGQKILNTMHGSPLKRIGYMESTSRYKYLNKYNNAFTHILCLSDFFKEIVKESFDAKEDQCLVLGYPRNDAMFRSNDTLGKLGLMKESQKYILWVPTWRRDKMTGNNNDSTTEFPILTEDNIESLNNYLMEHDVTAIIKPHPFQLELDLFKKQFSNIRVVTNKDLNDVGVDFYEMFNDVDALLTDYSSVYFDFLLTQKPLGFTIDDYASYEDKRGFVVDDARELMPGHLMYSEEDFKAFINDLDIGQDDYKDARKELNDKANKYQDGNSTKRVLDYFIK